MNSWFRPQLTNCRTNQLRANQVCLANEKQSRRSNQVIVVEDLMTLIVSHDHNSMEYFHESLKTRTCGPLEDPIGRKHGPWNSHRHAFRVHDRVPHLRLNAIQNGLILAPVAHHFEHNLAPHVRCHREAVQYDAVIVGVVRDELDNVLRNELTLVHGKHQLQRKSSHHQGIVALTHVEGGNFIEVLWLGH